MTKREIIRAVLEGQKPPYVPCCAGGYILAPAHDVHGDVVLGNMLAFIEVIQSQPGYCGN